MQHYRIEGNQITFTDQRFYELNGIFCPSVTTILQAYPKDANFFKWLKENGEDSDAIRDAAGERGSNVHKMTENYDEGHEVSLINESGRQQWSIQEWSMFSRWVEFRNEMMGSMKIMQTEMTLIDTDLQEAGTLDRFVVISGKRIILDLKTSNAIYPSYWLQLAAYKRLFERSSSQVVDAVGIVWLNARTRGSAVNKIQGQGWQLLLREGNDIVEDLDIYDATKKLWRAQNKNLVPKQISYKLSHQLS